MSEVKRFYIPGIEFLYDDEPTSGEFVALVLATDYAAIEAENTKLRAELERRVPDGWKLVPDDLCVGMRESGKRVIQEAVAVMTDVTLDDLYAAMIAAAPSAPKADERPLYTCIGKGGEYRYLGTAIGAGDSRGELAEVYQDRTGQLFHRTPEDFMERMEPIAAARKGEQ